MEKGKKPSKAQIERDARGQSETMMPEDPTTA